jgi:hypothetical protein
MDYDSEETTNATGTYSRFRMSARPYRAAKPLENSVPQHSASDSHDETLAFPEANLFWSETVPDTNLIWEQVDSETELADAEVWQETVIIGSATVVATALSAGHAAMTFRGGCLMASFLSSVPAWRTIDPLPILDAFREQTKTATDDDEEDESLQSMVAGSDSKTPRGVKNTKA